MALKYKHRLLLVDDEESIIKALYRSFRKEGYEIHTASSGQEGLEVLKEAKRPFSLIISDQRMPGMTGAQFLEKAKKILPDTIRILLTGYSDMDAIVDAINKGEIHRYLTKPWSEDDLLIQIRQALEQYELRAENRRLLALTSRQNRELEKERDLLRTVIDTLPDYIYVKDTESRYVVTNNAQARFLGAKRPEEVAGKTVFELFPQELASQFCADDHQVIRLGQPLLNREERSVDERGRSIWNLTTKVPLRDSSGKIVGLVGIARDITERKQTEEALRESEEKYKTLTENSLTGVFIHQDGKYVFVNERFAEIHGYKREELLGKDHLSLVHPDQMEAVRQRTLQRLKGEAIPHRHEVLSLKKDGEPIWCGTHVTRIQYRGRPAIMGNMIDISERKQMEETLRESEERYRNLYESSQDGITGVDMEGNILECNQAFLDMLGYTREEIKKLTYQQLTPAKWHEMEADIVKNQIAARGYSDEYEKEYIRKDGTIFPITDRVWLRKDEKLEPVGMWGIVRDISERKKMEEDRARLINKLQKTNKELENSSQELKQTTLQLVQSEKMSALGELTAGVAHELNQPLNGIKIISQSILRDMEKNRFEEDKLGEDLTEIVNQVNKMAGIIDHMRVFTRKSEGMPKETIDLNTVIEGPFKLLNQQLKDHNIEVVTELAPALPRVMCDPIRLEQVFMNLITNARNAVDSYGEDNKRIEIRTYKVDNRREVAAEVKDNGGGIPEDLKDKIFQPFFTTREVGKGTGLGLSVSGKIVEEHRGRIELESEEGKGSTFRVILPIAG